MEEQYGVYLGNQLAGKVQLRKQGLYFHVVCRCKLSGEVIHRLYASCDGKRENLGVLVPMDNGFGLDTKVPVKRLGEGSIQFELRPKQESLEGTFVPIYPEEPFAYISRLKDSYLLRRDGQIGIMV